MMSSVRHFDSLEQFGKVAVEYVWIGGNGPLDLRSKTKVLDGPITKIEDIPEWKFDGVQTAQAPLDSPDVVIKPQGPHAAMFRDPFRPLGDNKIVLCDCWSPDGRPLVTNTRQIAEQLFDLAREMDSWFGVEQEYTVFCDGKPLGWPSARARSFGGPTTQLGYPGPQGPYYCAAGADVSFGRDIADAHLKACMYAGVKIGGLKAQAMPGQWAFQIGPCTFTDAGDHLTVARYMLMRVGEAFGYVVSFDPKPIPGDWSGAGCHTQFSTAPMRKEGGYALIRQILMKLEKRHIEHINAYGEGNERRLTGMHETAPIDTFSWGVANCLVHIRIPRHTEQQGCGFIEDRRPASNMDPYIVTSMLFKTCCLD